MLRNNELAPLKYHYITHSCHCSLKNYEYPSYYLLLSLNVTKYWTRASRSNTGTLSFVEGQGFVSAFGIVSFAFVCHDSAFLLNNTLKDNHKPSRWACITYGALGSALLICLSLAVPGFLTFRDGTCGNLLNNYDPDAVAIIVMRAVYVSVRAWSSRILLSQYISFISRFHVSILSLKLKSIAHTYHKITLNISARMRIRLWRKL